MEQKGCIDQACIAINVDKTMQLEFAMLKQDNVDENTTDDGFLDAINATAAEVWGDENE